MSGDLHDEHPAGDDGREAPGALRVVQELINTHDLDDHSDALGDAGALSAWLTERGLAAPGSLFDAADLARVHAVREGLRAAALVHSGHDADPAALERLRSEAARAPLEVRFEDGRPLLSPAATGASGAIAQVLAIVARAEADGSWARFKACPADDCHWAFYDHSRNRSRTWCSMVVCGNRAKARAYRARSGRGA